MSFACSCKAVRDQTVVAAIIAGARSVDEITIACSAGADCETCIPTLEELLEVAANTGLIRTEPSGEDDGSGDRDPEREESNSGGPPPT